MYYFSGRWHEDYKSMLTYDDGEYRNDSKKNDYSEETTDAKMKSYWIFDWESSVLVSYLAHILLEILIKPDDFIRKSIRLVLLGVFVGYRIFTILVLDYRGPFIHLILA